MSKNIVIPFHMSDLNIMLYVLRKPVHSNTKLKFTTKSYQIFLNLTLRSFFRLNVPQENVKFVKLKM